MFLWSEFTGTGGLKVFSRHPTWAVWCFPLAYIFMKFVASKDRTILFPYYVWIKEFTDWQSLHSLCLHHILCYCWNPFFNLPWVSPVYLSFYVFSVCFCLWSSWDIPTSFEDNYKGFEEYIYFFILYSLTLPWVFMKRSYIFWLRYCSACSLY